MDVTTNDLPMGYEVEGYPTLYFKPRNSGPVFFDKGERTLAALSEFIEAHRSKRDEL